jgi:transposase InsO family protein
MDAAEDFHQLKLHFRDSIQHDYEAIRPLVVHGEPVARRSEETDIPRATLADKAKRFVEHGMLGLVDLRVAHAGRKGHTYPPVVAQLILSLKQHYPPIHDREIVRIVERKLGYKTNHHTVRRFLEQHPIPVQLEMQLPTFHDFEDAYQARYTVVRMHFEGWNDASIAGCLKLSRRHVGRILEAFARDGFAALEDKRTRPAAHPANQLTLPLLLEVLDIQQEYPKAGRFRVHGLLEERLKEATPSQGTVGRAMAKNRAVHGAPGPWSTDRVPEDDGAPKDLPYKPTYRHEYWFVDIRYLVQRDRHWIYSICVIEGYSRKMLAGMASEYQDLIAVFQLLAAAFTEYGCPRGLVSDNGSVFTSHEYLSLLDALEIAYCPIEKGKPWQNLIEAQFKIQLRLADHKFEQAADLEAIQAEHAKFVETFNTKPHGAHQDRADGLRTPLEVLSWVRGRIVEPERLQQVLRHLQCERAVDRHGYISIQRFYLYAERGLARKRVSIWLYEGRLHIEYQQTMLARYQYSYDRRAKRLRNVRQPELAKTAFRSPQLELWELDEEQWRKILERPAALRRRKPGGEVRIEQLPLLGIGLLILVLLQGKRWVQYWTEFGTR